MTTGMISESTPAARGFDFWIGEWDLTWEGGAGTNLISAILDGRVIEEQFCSNDRSLIGKSVSVWNEQHGHWQQTWVDNQGSYIALTGGWNERQMILTTAPKDGGAPKLMRMVFSNISADQLDWSWESSADSGQSWSPQWQIHYQRKAKLAS